MVVDAATLLDKKSRKSLELLQGLKGTQLIIPRMGNEVQRYYIYHFAFLIELFMIQI